MQFYISNLGSLNKGAGEKTGNGTGCMGQSVLMKLAIYIFTYTHTHTQRKKKKTKTDITA